MLNRALNPVHTPAEDLPAGTVLLRRGQVATQALHLRRGRVAFGVIENGEMVHQLGVVEGPFWLEAAAALLGLSHAVDALAESSVSLQAMTLGDFKSHLKNLPEPVHTLMLDLAKAQRQQTEVAVSRLAKDADARFAEWLLRHAEPTDAQGSLAVILRDRKRLIAAQLGIAPETFSRLLKHLRERKLISGGGRVLNLLDPTGLQSLAGI
ncbi:MAG: Crp/Fnr family transcriptional regulator [Betaproteobacteria bacterium]|nr:Crp/Fnr family transcriptional regulator [Betaproteobacteria bacterium]NBZ98291.1 Crp/Fnr family transcriptional regulator [Betaproteobacteria bacterium]NDB44247.1 Crp/Fnr family transcriptional regulator [Betaproteobacteria bacterium]NDD00610.1 Crp/Fnr family transcriptional regulator [Betaproteobacteria bacterium]NDD22595.1 Crp/Fnr family transcriptional regulator [Betaproteobacteria bacterium]